MRNPKTAYELSQSQVWTPEPVVSFFWRVVKQSRPALNRVLDMGAGDGRFALGGHFKRYEGIEIDERESDPRMPKNAKVVRGCVFRHPTSHYDACIGNPPYVRHHDIESPWKTKIVERFARELGVNLALHGNLYLYFMCLGFLKVHQDGLLAFIVPFEWVSRPSAKPVREHIQEQHWNVSVYRFKAPIFSGVLTTASISIIDKQKKDGDWKFFDVLSDLKIRKRKGVSGSSCKILSHATRGRIWARRGISPGSQKIFALTDAERLRAGLTRKDVTPCVTTLRFTSKSLRVLNAATFEKHLVKTGSRCWLIRSSGKKLSNRVATYLKKIPKAQRDTYTCLNQQPWYAYEKAVIPKILFHSGFTEFGPKVLINSIGAQAVGSIYGILAPASVSTRKLQDYLLGFNFEKRVVAHAHTLKKVEPRQLNSVLASWDKKRSRHEKR